MRVGAHSFMADRPSPPPIDHPRDDGEGPWYRDGLRFTCLWPDCVACCTGEPGYVWVTPPEAQVLAAGLKMTDEAFLKKYARKINGRYALLELANGDCVFLGKQGCAVYAERPVQCQTYPFWPEVLESPEAWEAERKFCPGIGHGERVYSQAEIETLRDQKPPKPPHWYAHRSSGSARQERLAADKLVPRESGTPAKAKGGPSSRRKARDE